MKSIKMLGGKKKKIGLVLAMLMIMLAAMPANIFAQTAEEPSNYDTSDGSESDPYFISSLNNLYWLSQNSDEWDKHYKQTADIDASGTSSWSSGSGFSPIGNDSTEFTGTYDGQDHTIDGLYIDRLSTWLVGLFGDTDGATIENLGVTNVDITGDRYVGGLVGRNSWSSTVSNSYSTGSVYGSGYVGGLVGYNGSSSTVSNSYSTGSVSGDGDDVGGLVGRNSSSTVSNSFWDTEASGQDSSDGGTGKTTTEMKDLATFTDTDTVGLDPAWDFETNPNDDSADDDYWDMDYSGSVNNGYPYLSWQDGDDVSPPELSRYQVKRILWKDINQDWFNTGINIKNGDRGVITAEGFSNANPQELGWQGWVGPGGYSEDGADDGILPDAPFQSVIYKVGDGTPRYLGTGGGKITFDADGELWFNVNNNNPENSDGAFLFSVALEGEYPSDQGVLGDLSGDKTVSAYDASLILQYVVGLIDSFPVEKMSASKLAVPAIYELRIQNSSVKANEELIRLPIAINNSDSLTAGAFTIKYDNSVLKASAIMPRPQLSGAYWKSKIDEDAGEIRFAFAKSSPTEQSKDTDIALLEFEPIGNVEGVTTNLRFDDVQIAESISIKRINGSISFLPRKSALLQNYPNPFNPDTWIPFKLSDNANVVISIYDVGGQLVRKIGLGKMPAGMYLGKEKAVYWDGCNQSGERVSSGLYFYTLQARSYSATKRMLILK